MVASTAVAMNRPITEITTHILVDVQSASFHICINYAAYIYFELNYTTVCIRLAFLFRKYFFTLSTIGLSTYSNSKAGVLSSVAIFEKLWKQSELYEQLMKAHEQLKRHDKMQKEFIDIAAHELRTPIQPIIGLSEVVIHNTNDMQQAKLLEVINRNAKRLHRLTEDILDVTKIESQSLKLNKEQFNLNDVITNAIEDTMTNSPTIKLFNGQQQQEISVYADKGRISQVVSNLLDNAVKFTKLNKTILLLW
jgi:two-component system, OmpR family, sensor histidine kinase VicK